ncbi:MAG: PH domain-containing protein [Phycisphaerae bacterium]|nr:PH domain-containing protein [Phycisphaerae bacterium]
MIADTQVPYTLREWVDREIEPGERLQWMDMPAARLFTGSALGAFLFGIPWTGFAVFWTAMAAWGTRQASDTGAPRAFSILFPLFGVPFILIGLGMLSCPLWAYRKARRTVYAITDRRAILFEGGRSMTVRSFPPDKLRDVFRKERKDGSGDVIFYCRTWRDCDGDRHAQDVGFMRIRNAKAVEDLIQELAKTVDPRADDERRA